MATELKEINQTLRSIVQELKSIHQALSALNYNYVEINRRPEDEVTKESVDAGG